METRKENYGSQLRILRRGESLRSRQYRGVCVSVIHEWDSIEILRTEMDPGSTVEDREIGNFPLIHLVIEGSPLFLVADQPGDLIPGDSVSLRADEKYRISNPASSRSIILTILLKKSEEQSSEPHKAAFQATSPVRRP
ncbi:MAG: hypothetical protein HY695_16115 [Deltaproteobacteria bacterium]|nr:hypothetical protein [Deltaproteobacteria bacterium]